MNPGVYDVHLIVDGSACDHAWGRIQVIPMTAGSDESPRSFAAGTLSGGAWVPPYLRAVGQNFQENK